MRSTKGWFGDIRWEWNGKRYQIWMLYIYIWLGWLVGTSVKSRISEELHRGGTGRRGTGDKGGIWISWINVDCSYHPVNQNILSFRISFKKSSQTNELTKRNGINPSAWPKLWKSQANRDVNYILYRDFKVLCILQIHEGFSAPKLKLNDSQYYFHMWSINELKEWVCTVQRFEWCVCLPGGGDSNQGWPCFIFSLSAVNYPNVLQTTTSPGQSGTFWGKWGKVQVFRVFSLSKFSAIQLQSQRLHKNVQHLLKVWRCQVPQPLLLTCKSVGEPDYKVRWLVSTWRTDHPTNSQG